MPRLPCQITRIVRRRVAAFSRRAEALSIADGAAAFGPRVAAATRRSPCLP